MESASRFKSTFESFVSRVHDPRVNGRTKYPLLEMIVIAVCAVVTGARCYVDIAEAGEALEPWLKKYLPLKNGIPSHDTFRRVFSIIDAKELEVSFLIWVRSITDDLTRISMDGKSVKGSVNREAITPVSGVNVYDHDSGIAIGQMHCLNAGLGEIKGVLEALDSFDVKGCLISVDAGSSCPSVAAKIKEKKADYLMPIRDLGATHHKPAMFELFNEIQAFDTAVSFDKKHGRTEERRVDVLPADLMPDAFQKLYPSTKTIIRIMRIRSKPDHRFLTRETKDSKLVYGKKLGEMRTSVTDDYFISSRKLSAKAALTEIREHWAIENKLHWQLDVAFGEDDWQVRDKVAVRNLSVIRKIAYNILTKDPEKISKRRKMIRACLRPGYLEKYLFNPANFPSENA